MRLQKYSGNPIIKPEDFPGSYAIFNPGQAVYDGKILLLVPICHKSGKYCGQENEITAHVATTEDGVNFNIKPEPFFVRDNTVPYSKVSMQCIDFRITQIEDTYYIIHPGCSDQWGTIGILSKTKDFKSLEHIDIISLPDNRMPCLFPEKINGKFVRLDRPYRVCPNDYHEMGNIWLSSSPDMIHWGGHRPLLQPFSYWATTKIGPTPPIKTEAGWLVIIHGVSRSATGHRYSIGAMLLDIDDPLKIIGLTCGDILSPEEPYEFNGIVPNVCFPAGSLAFPEKDEIRIYYGCSDTFIGLATGSLSELIQQCINEMPKKLK